MSKHQVEEELGGFVVGDRPGQQINPPTPTHQLVIGEGRIWDGERWLRTAPGCETISMLNMRVFMRRVLKWLCDHPHPDAAGLVIDLGVYLTHEESKR